MIESYLSLIGGLVSLIFGGEMLVRQSVNIALRFKVSSLVIGMTIVSFGTSVPELLVSLKAAMGNHPEIAVGNVIGSNIANIALVLGLTTIVFPVAVNRKVLSFDWPVMMFATVLFYVFILNRVIDNWEGLIYVVGLIALNVYFFISTKKKSKQEEQSEHVEKHEPIVKNILLFLLGIVALAFGTEFLVTGAVDIAKGFGVSEYVIGVTMVAFGTSLPELITSIISAFKKETNILLGNLIGSNIFNLAAVLGITAMVKKIPISAEVLYQDVYWLLGIAILLFLLLFFSKKIGRLKGMLLFLVYVVYIIFVVV